MANPQSERSVRRNRLVTRSVSILLAATLFRTMTPLNRILSSLQLMSLGRDAVELFAKELSEHERNAYVPAVEPQPIA